MSGFVPLITEASDDQLFKELCRRYPLGIALIIARDKPGTNNVVETKLFYAPNSTMARGLIAEAEDVIRQSRPRPEQRRVDPD